MRRELPGLSTSTLLAQMLLEGGPATMERLAADFPGGAISLHHVSVLLNAARAKGKVEFDGKTSTFHLTATGRRGLEIILQARARWASQAKARASLVRALLRSA